MAEVSGGLLEAHVTGTRSASPPPWLTFGGSGQGSFQLDQTGNGAAVTPADSYTGCRVTEQPSDTGLSSYSPSIAGTGKILVPASLLAPRTSVAQGRGHAPFRRLGLL